MSQHLERKLEKNIGGDPTTRVLNASTGAVALTLDVPSHFVYAVRFSPDGQHLAIATQLANARRIWEGYVLIMNTSSGLEVRRLPHTRRQPVLSVAYSPDGKTLVTSDIQRAVRIWNATNGEELQTLGAPPEEHCDYCLFAFSPDSQYMISGTNANRARIWDVSTGAELVKMPLEHGGGDKPRAIAVSSDGAFVITGSHMGESGVKVWA